MSAAIYPPAEHGSGRSGAEVHVCPVVELSSAGQYTRLWLHAPALAAAAQPGQFVMVTVPGAGFHLRRPLSLHRVRRDHVALLFEVRGEGTKALAAARVGDVLTLSGAIGRGYPVDGVRRAILVGGGVGAAPLAFLADVLAEQGTRVASLVGVRGAAQADVLGLLDLPGMSVATQDGSAGVEGTVVDALRASASAQALAREGAMVFACGPLQMLVAVREWAAEWGLRGSASLEAHLACGTGACHGCVVPTTRGYARVCVDGPVFPLEEVVAS